LPQNRLLPCLHPGSYCLCVGKILNGMMRQSINLSPGLHYFAHFASFVKNNIA
jgi:hypothetical protein